MNDPISATASPLNEGCEASYVASPVLTVMFETDGSAPACHDNVKLPSDTVATREGRVPAFVTDPILVVEPAAEIEIEGTVIDPLGV